VTDAAGLRHTGWASSVCAGDFDNDGWTDLFITYYGRNVLYRNRGGRFEDVTAQAGLPTTGVRWGSGCTFVDYDRDGRVDLFVANYLRFDLAAAPEPGAGANCLWKGVPVNCGPKGLPTDTNLLYRNRGDGTFVDVSDASGVSKVTGRYSMTAVTADLDGDGWPDIYVASDSTAAILYRNNHDGTLSDVAVESGAAYSENGNAQAGMGVAVGDYDGDGRLDLFKTHFADDMPSLYRNLGKGLFDDVANVAGLGVENRYVEWGAGMPDLDNDGRPDLFYVTGNVYPEIEALLPRCRTGARASSSGTPAGLRAGDGAERRRRRRALEPGRRVRRLRQRRRHRRAGDEHERAAVAAAERPPPRTSLDRARAGRDALQPLRDWCDGGRHRGRADAGANGLEPVELLLARRLAAALRPRRQRHCGKDRSALARGRHRDAVERSRGPSPRAIKEGPLDRDRLLVRLS
jgi:hypothetical protein